MVSLVPLLALPPRRRRCRSLQRSPSLLNVGEVLCLFPQSDAKVPTLPRERRHDPQNVVDAGLYLGLLGEVGGQSRVTVEARGAPGPAHLDEVVQSAGVHGHVPSPEPAALTLDQDELFVALGRDHQRGVQEAGAPGVGPCLDVGGHHLPDPDVHAPVRSAGADGLDLVPLLSLSAAVTPDLGVTANGPNPEPGHQLKGALGHRLGETVRHHGLASALNPAHCLEDIGQSHTHHYLAREGPNLLGGVEEGQSPNLSLQFLDPDQSQVISSLRAPLQLDPHPPLQLRR